LARAARQDEQAATCSDPWFQRKDARMARFRFLLLFGASLSLTFSFLIIATAGADDVDDPVIRKVTVQEVFAKGKAALLEENNPAKAVEILEKDLSLIDGNKAYLMLLRDAYQKHVVNLYLYGQSELAKKYLNRLRILDPQAADQLTKNPQSGLINASSPANQPAASTAGLQLLPKKIGDNAVVGPAAGLPTEKSDGPDFRAKADDEDPFSLENAWKDSIKTGGGKMSTAKALLTHAETKFQQGKFEEARQLFDKAYQTDHKALTSAGVTDRWAYCKFKYVVDQLNHSSTDSSLSQLENEVKSALALKPNAKMSKYGMELLGQIAKQRQAQAAIAPGTQVQHLPKKVEGWQVAETSHFRVFHNQPKEFAEQVAQVAEHTRVKMTLKWFGASAKPWKTKCEVYLHTTGKEYFQKTKVPPQSPGHSRIESDNGSGEVVCRQIELRCDNPDLLVAVLPHETTHVVLAGQFGNHQVPRWVDEGVAVLTEPKNKINLHLKNLPQHHNNHELFSVKELVEMKDYPHPSRIGAFYAQSVSLVDYLANKNGPKVFSQFVYDGLTSSYEDALNKHYKLKSFQELQSLWMQHVLASLPPSSGGYAKK
jgi:tetratricopeptide (TPR) repeat protein